LISGSRVVRPSPRSALGVPPATQTARGESKLQSAPDRWDDAQTSIRTRKVQAGSILCLSINGCRGRVKMLSQSTTRPGFHVLGIGHLGSTRTAAREYAVAMDSW
jgi:hypothetical protein